jgi:oligopeptidase A
MNTPLLSFDDLPLFDQIRPEHVAPAIDHLLTQANVALETVTTPEFPARWGNIASVLDVATEKLGRAWGAVSHLNSVADTPELRAAYNEALPKVTEFYTRLGADQRLYAKYKAIDPATLNAEQAQAHKNALRNFVLGGAELVGAERERFAAIQERQAELGQKFSENALDATDAFAYYAGVSELDGVPDDMKQTARAAARAEDKEGFKLTLKMPCYLPVMQFAKRSALREKLYRAYVTRASDQADVDTRKFDNSALISEMLALRLEEARLLGYRNFGELSIVPKMAESPQHVVEFLRDLASKARPFAEKDLADLRQFAAQPTRRRGTGLTSAKNSRKPATPSASRKSNSISRCQKCWPVCSRLLKRCLMSLLKETPPRSGTPRLSFTGSSAPMPWSVSSTLILPRATASAGAPGWTTCVAAGCARIPIRCRRRWRIWYATLLTALMASRRC